MSKRQADKQLTMDNFNNEDAEKPQNAGVGIQFASDDVRRTRKILTGRRRMPNPLGTGKLFTFSFLFIDSLFFPLQTMPNRNCLAV